MKKLLLIAFINFCILISSAFAQTSSLSVITKISEDIHYKIEPQGRIFLFVSNGMREPRFNTWPNKTNMIFAINLENWQGNEFVFNSSAETVKSVDVSLENLSNGEYQVQILWDQNNWESNINATGNLYSEAITVNLKNDTILELPLAKIIKPRKFTETKYLKEVDFISPVLSEWWGKEVHVKAAVFLPRTWFDQPDKKYPVRYNIAGYGGRHTRAARMQRNIDWWLSDDAPDILNVFLDGEGPFGDCYQLDSENSGPYGTALVEELIPYIEKEFRGKGTPESRFVEGCSTGGWVSLALQLFYPEFFGGCFSYSPDQVDFENCQLINIYKDDNAFYNEFDYLRPIVRDVTGEPIVSQKDFIQFENVLGRSNTYVTSGGQFSAFTALFSPKGDDGLPTPLFDPVTGKIDHEVAEYWRKHDLKDYVKTHWKTLGPKIQGKIWIWGADMDNFYLNPALRAFDKMLKQMENPRSDASIHFTPMARHCQEYSDMKVLLQIADKLQEQ